VKFRRGKDEGERGQATPEAGVPPSLNVFLSYRRDDASAYALLLFESLTKRYGNNVFMDIDSLAPGMDFVDAINDTLGRCDILLALVGRGWLNASDADGNPRLDNPEDFVRLEIEAALLRNIRVVPVLVGGALMPRSSRLPGELARLARRHAFELSDTRWHTDVAALIRAIEHVPKSPLPGSLEPGIPVSTAPPAEAPGLTGSTLDRSTDARPTEPIADETIARTFDAPLATSKPIDQARSESSIGQEITSNFEAAARDAGQREFVTESVTEVDSTTGSPRGSLSSDAQIGPASKAESIRPVAASSDVQSRGATVKARRRRGYYEMGATALVLIAVIVALLVSPHRGGPQSPTTSTETTRPAGSPSEWSQASTLTGSTSDMPIYVSCASPSFCVAVNSGIAFTFDGTRWSTPSNIDPTTSNGFNAVSCPSSSFCVAIEGDGDALTYNGSTWSQPLSIDGGGTFGVSCPSSTFCMAVDGRGYALTFNGHTWSQPLNIHDDGNVVSCPSSSFCAAVTTGGDALTFNGTSWSRPLKIDKNGLGNGISCWSSTFCVATDASGYVSTFNGATWSQPKSINNQNSLNAVSCPSSSFCMAVDNGHALTFNGATWSRPKSIDPKEGGLEVSCPSPSFCGVVDFQGRAYIYHATS
jgi:TIR domain